MLFTKIVPRCRSGCVTLVDGWLRKNSIEVGVIAFETSEGTSEEYEKLQGIRDASWLSPVSRCGDWHRIQPSDALLPTRCPSERL
jgi:hypothetical protein